jgi:hypothetical protein
MDLLNEYNINKPGKVELPTGWKQYEVDPDPDPEENIEVEAYSAPMEGWDEEHHDSITIMKTPDVDPETGQPLRSEYYIVSIFAFGEVEEDEKRFNSLPEARKRALELMSQLSQEWETDDEEELDEYKVNNPYKYPDITLIIQDDGETLLDADSGEYVGDIDSDNNVSYGLILNNDISDFMDEDDAFEEYAPKVFKVIRDKANGKIEALGDYVGVTANIDDLKRIFNVQIV